MWRNACEAETTAIKAASDRSGGEFADEGDPGSEDEVA